MRINNWLFFSLTFSCVRKLKMHIQTIIKRYYMYIHYQEVLSSQLTTLSLLEKGFLAMIRQGRVKCSLLQY